MDGLLHSFFERYGLAVAKHAYVFVVCPVALTLLLSTGLVNFQQQLDLDALYLPKNAPSVVEAQAARHFWDVKSGWETSSVQLLLENYGHNMLELVSLRQILKVHDYVIENLTYTFDGGRQLFWTTLCQPQRQCRYANVALNLFLRSWLEEHESGPNPNVRFKYPFLEALGNRLFLGYNLMGVNDTAGQAKMIILNYPVVVKSAEMASRLDAFERSLRAYVSEQFKELPYILFSRNFMSDETMKSALSMVPAIGFLLLFMFSFTIISNVSLNDPVNDKRWQGAAGCVSSIMAIMSSVGVLQLCQVPFNGTIIAVPFLAMAIGIDDTFLTIQAWKMTSAQLSPARRLSLTIRESGVAITLTSMTDIALFSIGLLSEMPAIQVFSMYTAAAMAFDYLYQMTFFVAVVYLLGKREAIKRTKLHNGLRRHCVANVRWFSWPSSGAMLDLYIGCLRKPVVKTSLAAVYLLYLVVSFWGCSRMRADFSASKLVVRSSPAWHFSHLMDSYYLRTVELQVIVRRPPDFLNGSQVREFLQFVRALESTAHSGGADTTNLWYHNYANYMQLNRLAQVDFYNHLDGFFALERHKQHLAEIRWRNESDFAKGMASFCFTTNFQTKSPRESWAPIVGTWRRLVEEYGQFEPITYGERKAHVADQLARLAPNTLQTIGTGILCLMLMTALFMPSARGVMLVGSMLLSTDLGVIGLLAWWDVDLDPISMINILMSLDLSIEYATHVCHFYLRSTMPDVPSRLKCSLSAVGWPVTQGALATVLGVMPLTFVDYYISKTFFKTCFLVVLTGIFHAFVVMPMVMLNLQPGALLSSHSKLVQF